MARTDHPRIRGEHQKQLRRLVTDVGSSPHTRGAPRQRRLDHQPVRIIPAYAGSTVYSCQAILHVRDHPRIRGEHLDGAERIPVADGSSPHTRGAQGDG